MNAASGLWRAGALAALCCATAGAGVAWWRAGATRDAVPTEVRIGASGDAQAMTGQAESTVAITPDGHSIAYSAEHVDSDGVARGLIVLRRLDTGKDQPLLIAAAGAEARSPFFSDDGRSVGFIDRGRLMTVPVQGGAAVERCACGASPAGGALWLRNDAIVYRADGRLRVVEPNGRRRDLTRPDALAGELDHLGPAVLPDQETVLYTVVRSDATTAVKAVNLRTGRERLLVNGGMFARYAGDGHLLYVDAASQLHVADLDLDALRLSRDTPITDRRVHASSRGGAGFAVSATGTIVYAPAVGNAAQGLVLSWVTRDGVAHASGLPAGPYAVARISPRGDAVAIEVRDAKFNIWLWDLTTNALTPQTTGRRDTFATWMPDGRSLLMYSSSQENAGVLRRLWLDGSGRVTPVAAPVAAPVALTGVYAVAPDGQVGVFRSERPGQHLRAMPPDGGAVLPLTQGTGRETAADLSPDGRWMVYDASPRGGRAAAQTSEVFVQPFPAATPARQQISVDGGSRPLWSRDGREIIYVDRRNRLMRVEVTGGDRPVFGPPAPVFADPSVTADWYFGLGRRSFDLTHDGSRFLAVMSSTTSVSRRPSSLVVASNWLEHRHQPWAVLMDIVRRRAA